MGISNLHKELRPYTALIQLETLRGRRCGVDAMAWLHRGCAACATELGTGDLWCTPWQRLISLPAAGHLVLAIMQVDCQGPARTIHLILLEDAGDADNLRYHSCRESALREVPTLL